MNIRIDEDIRRELKDFAAELGMPTSSLVTACIKQMLRTRSVTFSAALRPTPYLAEMISTATADYEAGRDITVAETDEETLAHLRSL